MRRGAGRAAAGFVLGLAASSAAAIGVWQATPLEERHFDIARHDQPLGGAHYVAHNRNGHVDHHVLYHRLSPTANDALREAEVLFLGNSRLMLALPRPALRGFFGPRRQPYYVLGFGHQEAHAFSRAVLEAHRLRPRLIVVNTDGFFDEPISPWGQRVLEDTRFDAAKWWFESALAHETRRMAHQVWPHWLDLTDDRREWIVYRSAADGSWFLGTRFGASGPLPVASDLVPPTEARVRTARTFVKAMRATGAHVVFSLIPNRDTSLASAQLLAGAVGVPLVAPRFDDLETMDGSHLTAESARRFAKAFLAALASAVPPGLLPEPPS